MMRLSMRNHYLWYLSIVLSPVPVVLIFRFQKPNEEVRGITADPVRKTYWVYTDSSLFELNISNEARDVWRVYLDKGMFDVALRYAKVSRV